MQKRSFAYDLVPKLENKKDGYYYFYLKAKDFNPFNSMSDIMLLRRAAVVGYPVLYSGKCSEIISAEVNVLRETFK
jgi:hypothetical protein